MRYKESIGKKIIFGMILTVFALFFLGPILMMFMESFKTIGSQSLSLENYFFLFKLKPVLRIALNSIIVAGFTTLTTIIFGSMAGYALAKLEFFGRNLLLAIVLISVMFPIYVNIVPLFVIVRSLGIFNTLTAAMLPHFIYGLAVFLFRQFYLGIPDELLEAGRIDGAGEFRLWFSVIFPISKPVIVAVSILTFFKVYEDVIWPLIVLKNELSMTASQTIVLFLSGTYNMNTGLTTALGTLFTLPIVILFYLLQRHFIQGITMTGIKS